MIGKIRKIYAERKRQTLAAAALLSGFIVVALFLFLLGGEDKGLLGEKKPRGSIKILRGVDLAREKWRIEGEKRLGMIETEQREIKKTLEAISTALGELEKEPSDPYPYPPPQAGVETSPEAGFPPAPPLPGAAVPPPEPPKTQNPIRVFSPLGGAPAEGQATEPALLKLDSLGKLRSRGAAKRPRRSHRNRRLAEPPPRADISCGTFPPARPEAHGHSAMSRYGGRLRAAREREGVRKA